MAGIDADMNKILATQVVDLYNNAETDLLEKIANRLKAGVDAPGWEIAKLRQIQQMRDDVQKQVNILNKEMPTAVNSTVKKAYKAGLDGVDKDLIKQGLAYEKNGQMFFTEALGAKPGGVGIAFGTIDQRKVEAIAKALQDQLKLTHPQVLRYSDDVYRSTIVNAVMQEATGTLTMRQAVQFSLTKFAIKGVSGFVDKAGRNWTLGAYSEMACRTGYVQANLAGTQDRMDDLGIDLVIVSVHSAPSPLCLPWEGKVLRQNE
jgi:hypothetical protein